MNSENYGGGGVKGRSSVLVSSLTTEDRSLHLEVTRQTNTTLANCKDVINSQSLKDTQAGNILQKYTVDKYNLDKYILEQYTLEKNTVFGKWDVILQERRGMCNIS